MRIWREPTFHRDPSSPYGKGPIRPYSPVPYRQFPPGARRPTYPQTRAPAVRRPIPLSDPRHRTGQWQWWYGLGPEPRYVRPPELE